MLPADARHGTPTHRQSSLVPAPPRNRPAARRAMPGASRAPATQPVNRKLRVRGTAWRRPEPVQPATACASPAAEDKRTAAGRWLVCMHWRRWRTSTRWPKIRRSTPPSDRVRWTIPGRASIGTKESLRGRPAGSWQSASNTGRVSASRSNLSDRRARLRTTRRSNDWDEPVPAARSFSQSRWRTPPRPNRSSAWETPGKRLAEEKATHVRALYYILSG